MTVEIPDLWGEIQVNALSPIALLRHQAGQLRHRTKGLLEAEVITSPLKDEKVLHRFVVIAPALDRSSTVLFNASHREKFGYPVEISFSPWIRQAQEEFYVRNPHRRLISPIPSLLSLEESLPTGNRAASSQERLMDLLRELFSSEYTTALISSLLARINDEKSESPMPQPDASAPAPSIEEQGQ